MAKITYLLGAGASYYSCPILENQAEMMVTLAKRILGDDQYFLLIEDSDVQFNFIDKEFSNLSDDNKYKILWYIGYFGEKAKEYGTIDTYARKLDINEEKKELRLLKMCVSVFFDLWENFYYKDYFVNNDLKFNKIDNRYKALFSVLIDNKGSKVEINNDFKFITWNYDLQLEETFKMFLNGGNSIDLNFLNKSFFKFKNSDEIENNVFHLNGHRGFFTDITTRNNYEEFQIKIADDLNIYWDKIHWLFESTERGSASFDNYIKYAWEHDTRSKFLNKIKKVINQTDVLIIIGYSFPAFNRKIDQLLFNEINPAQIKKIIYQDPNANKQIVENLFKKPDLFRNVIEIVNEEKSLKQFYLPNEYFISQVEEDFIGVTYND